MYWPTNAFKHADMCERTQRDTDMRACARNDAVGSRNADAAQKRSLGDPGGGNRGTFSVVYVMAMKNNKSE